MIDEGGGRAVFDIDGHTVLIDVPPGAVDEATKFTASRAEAVVAGTRGPTFDLGPSGLQFARPITVSLPSPDDDLGPVEPKYTMVAKPSAGDWERLARRETRGFVAASAHHFSLFGVIADPASIGRIGGVEGTEFEAGSVTLNTSEPIRLHGMTVAEGSLHILAASIDGSDGEVEFTLTGLRPSTTVYAYEGSLQRETVLHSDATGTGAFRQQLGATPSNIWFQDDSGTVTVSAGDPLGCLQVGRWEAATRTCWLGDGLTNPSSPTLMEQIEIITDDTTLDCRTVDSDFELTGDSVVINTEQQVGPAVVIAAGTTGATVRNCEIRARGTGVLVNPLAATGFFDPPQAQVLNNTVSTTQRFLPGVWLAAADSADVSGNFYAGPSGIFLEATGYASVQSNEFQSHMGVDIAAGSHNVTVFDNLYLAVDFGSVTAQVPAFGVRIADLSADNVIELNEFVGFAGSISPSRGILLLGTSPLRDGHPVANEFTQNVVSFAETGVVVVENGRADRFTHNRFESNVAGAVQYGTGGAVALDDLGNPIPDRFEFFHNDVVDNQSPPFDSPQISSDVPLTLANDDLGGNYWGTDCPPHGGPVPSDLFQAAGRDSNAVDVLDAAPFGIPVADFDDVDRPVRRLEASGCQDTDGDRFQDHEEFRGIDAIHPRTGAPLGFLDLPALGSDPDVPDLFLEVDYMPNARPNPAAVERVVNAFDRRGIQLHVDLGTAAPGSDFDLGGGNEFPGADVIAPVDRRKGKGQSGLTFMSTSAVKLANFAPERLAAFSYALYAAGSSSLGNNANTVSRSDVNPGDGVVLTDTTLLATPRGGVAEINGDRFTFTDSFSNRLIGVPTDRNDPDAINSFHPAGVRVSTAPPSFVGGTQYFFLGMAFAHPASRDREDALFMHEFGHVLGLGHGGGDNLNRKPNYPSVMNYAWGFPGAEQNFGWFACPSPPPRRVDYSSGAIRADLNEARLVEGQPISGLIHSTSFDPPPPGAPVFLRCTVPGEPVDWNDDGDTQDVCTNCSVNRDFRIDVLRDHDDWANLLFFDRGVAGFGPSSFEIKFVDTELVELRERPSVRVPILLKPGSGEVPPINVKARGVVPVAYLSTGLFDAVEVAVPESATFGPTGTETVAEMCALEDVDGAGQPDLVCHFRVETSGLTADSANVQAFVEVNGVRFGGIAAIRIVP